MYFIRVAEGQRCWGRLVAHWTTERVVPLRVSIDKWQENTYVWFNLQEKHISLPYGAF